MKWAQDVSRYGKGLVKYTSRQIRRVSPVGNTVGNMSTDEMATNVEVRRTQENKNERIKQ